MLVLLSSIVLRSAGPQTGWSPMLVLLSSIVLPVVLLVLRSAGPQTGWSPMLVLLTMVLLSRPTTGVADVSAAVVDGAAAVGRPTTGVVDNDAADNGAAVGPTAGVFGNHAAHRRGVVVLLAGSQVVTPTVMLRRVVALL